MHLLEGFAFYQEWKQCYLQRPVRPPLPKLPRYMRGTEQQQAERLKADYARKVHTLSCLSLSLSHSDTTTGAQIGVWEKLATELSRKADASLKQVLDPTDGRTPLGPWLVDHHDHDGDAAPPLADEARLEELKRIRNIYVPEVSFMLHDLYYDMQEYQRAVALADIVAAEQYQLYRSFDPEVCASLSLSLSLSRSVPWYHVLTSLVARAATAQVPAARTQERDRAAQEHAAGRAGLPRPHCRREEMSPCPGIYREDH